MNQTIESVYHQPLQPITFNLSQDDIEQHISETKYFQLNDGSKLAYLDLGHPEGKPVFFFHGLPGSRVEAIPLHEVAHEQGYRLIAPDRPGIGLSPPQKGRTLLDWTVQIEEMANRLGMTKFGIIGVSGGGPFTLACAYALSERIDFVLDVSGSAPIYTESASRNELSQLDRIISAIGSHLPASFIRPIYIYLGYQIKRMTDGNDFIKLFGNAISEPDQALVKQKLISQFLIRDLQESLQSGTKGIALETILNYKSWGFKLQDIHLHIHLFHGTSDQLVPFSFAEYKSRHLPHVTLNVLKDQGHFYGLLNAKMLFEYVNTITG